MTYSKQTKESSEQKNNTTQQKSTGVFVNDNRPSAIAAIQRQEQMATSSVHSAQRALVQKMADKQTPVQRAEDEELLQGKFETAQRVEDEELLQGKFATVQCAEDEELLQGKFETAQRVEEEELLQGKFEPVQRAEEEELLQGKFEPFQRAGVEEEEPMQGKFNDVGATQLVEQDVPKPNNTGLPDQLKTGIESLSGMSMDHVKVHYNSSQPAQLNAHAYAQGSEIHVAPGQEKHLPHEAWHVVQQAQGRVKPTMQMKGGVPVNDDIGLEAEADVMGAQALSGVTQRKNVTNTQNLFQRVSNYNNTNTIMRFARTNSAVIQRAEKTLVDVKIEVSAFYKAMCNGTLRAGANYGVTLTDVKGNDYTHYNCGFDVANLGDDYVSKNTRNEVMNWAKGQGYWYDTASTYDSIRYMDYDTNGAQFLFNFHLYHK